MKNFLLNRKKNQKKFNNRLMRKTRVPLLTHINYDKILNYLYLPPFWKTIIFKNNINTTDVRLKNLHRVIIYLYTAQYFFLISLPDNITGFTYNKSANVVFFQSYVKTNFHVFFWKFFNLILHSFTQFFFKKLKIRGKGYYIFKNLRNTIAIQFGYSHKVYIYTYFLSVKFLSKTSVILFGLNKIDLIKNSFELMRTRPQNIFTAKGVRFSKQIIYKKPSKVSN